MMHGEAGEGGGGEGGGGEGGGGDDGGDDAPAELVEVVVPEGDSNVRCSGGPMDASEHRCKKTPARRLERGRGVEVDEDGRAHRGRTHQYQCCFHRSVDSISLKRYPDLSTTPPRSRSAGTPRSGGARWRSSRRRARCARSTRRASTAHSASRASGTAAPRTDRRSGARLTAQRSCGFVCEDRRGTEEWYELSDHQRVVSAPPRAFTTGLD